MPKTPQHWISKGILFLVAIIPIACNNIFNDDDYNIKSIEVSPTESVPLAFGSLSIEDILSSEDSQYVKVYADGLVYLEYDQTLRSQSIRDLITIEDKVNITGSLSVPAGSIPPVATDVPSTQQTINEHLNLDLEKLTEILIKSGTLQYETSISAGANPNLKYAVHITVPEFTNVTTGNPLSIETTGASDTISLANHLYKTSLANPNGLTIQYTLIIKKNPNTVVIAPGTKVAAKVSFLTLDYKYIKGFLGNQTASLNAETVEIKAFGSSLLDGANVSFKQPQVYLQVINEVGVPTIVSFEKLEGQKPGATLAITSNPASPVSLQFPAVMGDSAKTDVNVTNANALLNFAPTKFFYKASAEINKGLTTGSNFITDTSELKVRMHVEVPLYGHASNIILSDTIEIDLSDADRSEITAASLKVKTENEIPLSANLQLYLTDDKFKILDSLLVPTQNNLVKGSAVNADGEFVSQGIVDELIPLSKDVLKKLFTAKNIIIKARVSTTKDGNTFPDVKFKSVYRMNVKLGLKVNAKIKIDL